MANIAQKKAEKNRQKRQRNRIRQRIVSFLGCVVVFITTYALILPAITLEKSCELEEHTHTDLCYTKAEPQGQKELVCTEDSLGLHIHVRDCYDAENQLVCGQADFFVHSHGTDCYDENDVLVCSLCEIEEHSHNDDCYELIQPKQGHTHADTCYQTERGDLNCQIHVHGETCYTQGQLTCRLPEESPHVHGEGCTTKTLDCTLSTEPHTHNEACYGLELCQEEHEHDVACAMPKLICGLGEEAHVHSDDCYKTEYLCGLTEAGHLHGTDCYEKVLTCTVEGVDAHEHTDACYAQKKTLICGEEEIVDPSAEPEKVLVCEKEVIKLHSHDDNCYETYLDDNQQEQIRLICKETVVLEHVHGDSCFRNKETEQADEELTCGQEESLGHTHSDSCRDDAGNLTCTLEESQGHTHTARCYGTWELTCGKEEHIHGDTCLETDQEEIPLVQPLVCTVEEHIHDTLCSGEGAVSVCEKIEHTHTADCYGEAVATFPYEDDQISMTVTVTNRLGLPEGMTMEVLLLDAEDQDYTAYEGYARENSDGELLGLTGYQIQFFYEGRQIQLPDAQVTAELTLKPVEYQQTEELTIQQTIVDNGTDLYVTEKFAQAASFMSLRMAEPAADAEPAEDAGEERKTVQITVLQQGADDIVSRGTASFSGEETQNNQMTLSLTGSNTFALVNQSLANPEFTVQYYANFPRMQRYTVEERNNTDIVPKDQWPYLLEVIDTSLDGDGDGGSLPENGKGIDKPGTTKGVTYLHLREVPGVTAGNDKLHENDTSTNRKVYEVMAELEQTQMYVDNSFTYYTGLGIRDIDALHENTHYDLVDLWIGKPDADGDVAEWTVYTTVAVNAASYKADGSDSMLAVDASVSDPLVSSDPNTVGQWMHGYGEDDTTVDFSKPWYRKFRQTTGDTTWINIPHGGNGKVTKIVRVADIHDLTFTNNEASADTNTIYISSGDVIRLVHDLPRTDQSMAANLFDYDITDTTVYISQTTSGTPELETPELLQGNYNSANQAMYLLGLEGYNSYNDRLYTRTTTGTSTDGYVAYGINSQEAYNNTTGAQAYLAFGNNNTSVFRANDQLGGVYINKANGKDAGSPTFKGCSFGLVKNSLANGQPFLSYADGIAHQALFNEEVLPGYSSPPGKTTYSRQQLVFRRMGDTYILTDVNRDIPDAKVKEDKLNQFTVSHVYTDGRENPNLFTNNFWPMDGTIDDSTVGHDMKFGSIDAGTGGKERYRVGKDGSSGTLPESDDGLAHNSYFGMTYSVEFQLDGKYCGPLEYLFYGDDDMWVYLTDVNNPSNSNLICDIGGVHSSVGSFTDLWDYVPKNTPGIYRLDFFYTERGASGSSCYMEFTLPNMASIPQIVPETGSVRVKKEVPNATVDEEFTFLFELLDYKGNDSFATSHTDSTGKLLASATIQNGGTFTLKAGEIISITGIPKGLNYRITEQLGENPKYNVSWKKQGVTALDDPNVVSGTVENGITHTYTCTNEALGSLDISKVVTGVEAGDTETDVAFEMLVTLTDADGNALNGAFGDFTFTNGQATVPVKHNETVTLTGIPVGALFTVQETTTDGYNVSYTLDGEMQYGENGKPAASVSGTIQYTSTTNTDGTVSIDNSVSIQVVNATGYELPETGGPGTTQYTMAGLLMILLSTAYLMYSSKARRKGAN